jgi:DNA helicase-2/ATP-dependent DNA helicase PcrA
MALPFSLDQLTASQRAAVEHKDGPLLVIAGPGSGKTRTITCRIARLIDSGVAPYNICAITFTNKAAEEMRERVAQMGVPRGTHVSTFHSLCVRILRQYAEQAGLNPNFSIYSDSEQKSCIKDIIKNMGQSSTNFPPARVLGYISNYKNDLLLPDDVDAFAESFQQKIVAKIYHSYQNRLKSNNAVDFDDLLMKVAFLFKEKPEVRRQLGERFRYILVDEYQDTNNAQYQIAKGLASVYGNLCVTGDPDQSIYKWRGADLRIIMEFEKDWPHAKVVKLEENFRSCPSILRAADKLIAQNLHRKPKRLIPVRSESNEISVNTYDSDSEEAMSVAASINRMISAGTDPNEIAVLYRVNSMSRSIEEAFIRQRVPYVVVRGVEFYNRKEIKDMLGYLKLISNPSDTVALERVINTPARGIGNTTVERLKRAAMFGRKQLWEVVCNPQEAEGLSAAAVEKVSDFSRMIKDFCKFAASDEFSVAELIERIYSKSGLEIAYKNAKDSEADAMNNIEELINSASFYDVQEREQRATLEDYLQMISLYSDSDAYKSDSGKVSLMTLHAAKGLEFDNVFIIGLEQGVLPHERSEGNPEELEEERRLFFVGITRARLNLAISRTKYRNIRGQQIRAMQSVFLSEAGLTTEEPSRYPSEPAGWRTTSSYYDKPSCTPAKKPAHSSTASSDLQAAFKKGMAVRHSKFGTGIVINCVEKSGDSVVTVQFKGQTKTLIQRYAKLEKI